MITVGQWLRVVAGVACGVGLVLVAACGAVDPSSGSAAISAPTSGAAEATPDPCKLLTPWQLRQLAVTKGAQQQSNDNLGGVFCTWSNIPASDGSVYSARLISSPVPSTKPAGAISGLNTTEVAASNLNPQTSCVYLLNVEQNRQLWVQYTKSGNVQGMNHQVACRKAQAAAADMAVTYRSLR